MGRCEKKILNRLIPQEANCIHVFANEVSAWVSIYAIASQVERQQG